MKRITCITCQSWVGCLLLLLLAHGCSGNSGQGDGGSQSDLALDSLPSRPDLPQRPDLPGGAQCLEHAHCDDGLACTQNRCEEKVCVTSPIANCAWPAESIDRSTNLTEVEGPPWNNGFYYDLSGAVWNPETQQLWVCRNTPSSSRIWVLEKDGTGTFVIGEKGGERGEWEDFGDLEGLTLADYDSPYTLYLMVEGRGLIQEVDLSSYGKATVKNSWNVASHLISGDGAEAITFVPDTFLASHGFVDAQGKPRTSKGGMGGLMLVGHQYGGHVYAFDLNRKEGTFAFVGGYKTHRAETAGLEFDRSTGQLYIWHDAEYDELEVTRLSSTVVVGGERKLDTIKVFSGPGKVAGGSDNHEGIAIASSKDCKNGNRSLFLTTDGGKVRSLTWFQGFPCRP